MSARLIDPRIAKGSGRFIKTYDDKDEFHIAVGRMEKAMEREGIDGELVYYIVPIQKKVLWHLYLL